MTDETRALLASGEALDSEIALILAEIDATLEAWDRSIQDGMALAQEMRNAAAVLSEWTI